MMAASTERNNLDKITRILTDISRKNNIPIYAVGGYIRDFLLGLKSKDIDFVVIGDSIAIAKELKQRINAKNLTIFKTYGTAHITCDELSVEFVSARKESYRSDSRKPKVEIADLNSDLSRRDFTINALACPIECFTALHNHFENSEKYIIDLHDGLNDIKKKIIRTPLEAEITFHDDPLRMLRAIRFAVRFGFQIESDCFKAIQNTAPRLKIISAERISSEFIKIMKDSNAQEGLFLLETSHLLTFFLPEWNSPDSLSEKLSENFSQFNDYLQKISAGFYLSGTELSKVKERMKLLKFSKLEIDQILLYLTGEKMAKRLLSEADTIAMKYFLFQGKSEWRNILKFWCILSSEYPKLNELEKELTLLDSHHMYSEFKLALDGNDLISFYQLKEGKEIGKILDYLTLEVLENRVLNTKDDLMDFLQKNSRLSRLF